jgi:hypothetical protein
MLLFWGHLWYFSTTSQPVGVGQTKDTQMMVITQDMKVKATRHLDELNNLRMLAASKHYETVGRIGEEQTWADAIKAYELYEATLQQYAKLGFRYLGIHSLKVGA